MQGNKGQTNIMLQVQDKNLRDPQECIDVTVPTRHINILNWWSLWESCMNSDIILRSLVAEKCNIQLRNQVQKEHGKQCQKQRK